VKAAELLDALRALGPELHIEAGYGREQERLAPWEAIDESRARAAVARCRTCGGDVPGRDRSRARNLRRAPDRVAPGYGNGRRQRRGLVPLGAGVTRRARRHAQRLCQPI
jgi:hypothetical protein